MKDEKPISQSASDLMRLIGTSGGEKYATDRAAKERSLGNSDGAFYWVLVADYLRDLRR